MEEPPPATAAPPDAPASEESSAQEGKLRRKRLRVPTSVLVTVLIAALSVWIAPTLTRQWDDRQKARELRVAMAEDIITKGTRAIYAATQPPLAGYKPAADYETLLTQWIESGAVIDAKLRAYFPDHVSDRWDRFDEQYMQPLLRVAAALPGAYRRHKGESMEALSALVRRHWTDHGEPPPDEVPDIELVNDVRQIVKTAHAARAVGTYDRNDAPGEWMYYLEQAVASPREERAFMSLRTEARALGVSELDLLTDEILSAHLTGFSTTRRDFLRDLLP